MKVLLVNGSPRPAGCTYTALCEIAKTLDEVGVQSEIFQLGNKPVRDCIACRGCVGKGKCVFGDEDVVNALIQKAQDSDGFVFGSPVYFAHPTGLLLSVLDRAFYAGKTAFMHKPGAAIVSARRGGTAASFDVINKYFTISQMPIVSSTYWNMVYGTKPDEVLRDEEGMQTMHNIAKNMAYLLQCIDAGEKAGVKKPEIVSSVRTNFIR